MIRSHSVAFALSTVLLAGSAMAQAQSDSAQDKAPAATQSSGTTAGAQSASPSAQSGTQSIEFISQQKANQWRGYKLIGLNVYGPNDEKVGEIREVLLSNDGKADAVVIGVGGFLGIGSKDVAVPFDAVQWKMEPKRTAAASPGGRPSGSAASQSAAVTSGGARDFPDHASITLSKEQLQNAPAFRYASDASRAATVSSAADQNAPSRPNR